MGARRARTTMAFDATPPSFAWRSSRVVRSSRDLACDPSWHSLPHAVCRDLAAEVAAEASEERVGVLAPPVLVGRGRRERAGSEDAGRAHLLARDPLDVAGYKSDAQAARRAPRRPRGRRRCRRERAQHVEHTRERRDAARDLIIGQRSDVLVHSEKDRVEVDVLRPRTARDAREVPVAGARGASVLVEFAGWPRDRASPSPCRGRARKAQSARYRAIR